MKKFWLFAALMAILAITMAFAVACGDDDDDDDDNTGDDDDDWSQYSLTLSGSLNYDGDKVGQQIMIAITDQWPMTGAPLWFGYVDYPADGFPATYKIGVEQPFYGDYYLLASIDLDTTDGYMPDFDNDPLALPEGLITLAEGDNQIDFTFTDYTPTDDDDDDTTDDDAVDDDATDDDTDDTTGMEGSLTYTGDAEGAKVVFGFWEGLPMGPPDYSAEVDVPESGFPFDYAIETEFTGTWKIIAFLDVDPNDGSSINFSVDPSNFSLTPPSVDIVDGSMATLDITLVDP